jgi:S-adenosylmethionine decarboxylase
MQYSKGLHLIADLKTNQLMPLKDFIYAKELLANLIKTHKLTVIGEVFHNFEGGGFTGMFCLTESHISIHTWPEFGRVTYDIFLSNYRNQNESIVRNIHSKLSELFSPTDITINELFR